MTPVAPEEILSYRSEFDRCVRHINQAIKRHDFKSGGVGVTVDTPDGDALVALERTYRQAGWEVSLSAQGGTHQIWIGT